MSHPIHRLRKNASVAAVATATRKRTEALWAEAAGYRERWQKGGLADCGKNKRIYDDASDRATEMEILAQHLERLAKT